MTFIFCFFYVLLVIIEYKQSKLPVTNYVFDYILSPCYSNVTKSVLQYDRLYSNQGGNNDVEARLMKVSYYDKKAEVRLEAYSDTAVIEKEGNVRYLTAIRLGGYPESVKGMSEAIYGGGTVSIEINGKENEIFSRVKQYRKTFSHDGIYAEATLLILDGEQRLDQSEDDSGNGGSTDTCNNPRKCYIFCEQGDNGRLFEELDKKTAVPLIPEFRKYVLDELQNRGILTKLQVISSFEKFDAWALNLSKGEANVISVVNDGLKSGAIAIPGSGKTRFPAIRSVTQYLNTFGVMIAERIKFQFNPLFDPAAETLSPEILALNEHVKAHAGYSLYNAQLAVAEAHKRCLKQKKSTLCISECGSGKTKIGLTALHAYQQRNNADTQVKHFNIVLCPSHMTKKWVREIEESLPSTFAEIVTSISEINLAYEAYQRDTKTCYVIISKERARDGFMKRPSVTWSRRRKAFICPICHKPVMMELIDGESKYKVPADQFFFKRENKLNHKCEHCDSLLWSALTPEQQSEWVKVSDLGFVHRRLAFQYLELIAKKPALYDEIQAIVVNPDGDYPNTGAYRRFPLSTYIKRHMKGKIDGLIVDELHNYNNNSGQGDAMGELFQAAKKVVGMTATLINGYSSGIFHLLYRISPDLMLKDGKSYDKSADFNSEYGVTESIYEIAAPDYNANRRTAKKKIRERQLPGVSPLVYSRFLMDSAAFLSLNDMGKELPEYEEIPIPLQMNENVAEEYDRLETRFKHILCSDKKIAKKILSTYLGLLTVYPDQPYGHKPVVHPITGDALVVPQDTSSFNELHEKDHSVLGVVKRKTAEGGRVLIYTSWVRIDSQEKLSKLLEENGYRVAILTSAVPPNKREEWVEKQVKNGIQVLITNPSLVETGLDLNDFTTLYFYNIAYNLFTLRQSSRRSLRINQKAPKIEVYFSYYEGTMQHRAVRLMASKLAVAGIIEGNFTDEGLAAMSDCADMTTALARELTQGIKNEVEDLSAVFKKMAKFKPECTASVSAEDAAEELFLDFSSKKVSPVTISYDPPENESPEKEAIQEVTFLQKFQRFKETFKSSAMPDSGTKTNLPLDFELFAEEVA
jgi:superfamily II DNA or RNA helicase